MPRESPQQWDRAVDLLVVGAGLAGLMAGIRATERGARTLLVEKLGRRGGGIAAAQGGELRAVGSNLGMTDPRDSPDVYFHDVMRYSDNRSDPRLIRLLALRSGEVIDWMIDHGWVCENRAYQGRFDTHPRIYRGDRRAMIEKGFPGGSPAVVLDRVAERLGIETLLNTRLSSLFREEGGERRVIGAEVIDEAGKTVNVRALKAVIIATGDFSSNNEMIARYNPRLKGLQNSFPYHHYCTGEGILLAMDVGAAITDMPEVQMFLCAPAKPIFTDDGCARSIWVNLAGERFVDESIESDVRGAEYRRRLSEAIVSQKEQCAIVLCDATSVHPRVSAQGGKTGPDLPLIADDPTTLAERIEQRYHVDAGILLATIRRYNECCDKGYDEEFGKKREWLKRLETPPFHAQRYQPSIWSTYGGLKINDRSQVLDTEGKIVPGLYAAGDCTGGFLIDEDGNKATMSLLFGMIAGANAAGETSHETFKKTCNE